MPKNAQITAQLHWHPTPVLLPGKSHGQRSLVGCSSWGREESDMTERLHFNFSLSCIGEGNGNPLQCSCLENPRDGGAWWAAVYGVTWNWTRLKRLSSSSSRVVQCGDLKWAQYTEMPCKVTVFNSNQVVDEVCTYRIQLRRSPVFFPLNHVSLIRGDIP